MAPRRRISTGVVALVVLVLMAGCVDYPPNPTVCLSCELGVEQATDDRYDVSVERSELRIQVADDGSGHWTVRSTLSGPDVTSLRGNRSQVDRLANRSVSAAIRHRSIHHPAIHGGEVRDVSGRLEGDVLLISFTVPDMADPGLDGILLVDFFQDGDDPPASYMLGTDRLAITGPPNTVVSNEPPAATVTDGGRTAEWRSFDGRVSSHTYVAFAPDDGRQRHTASEASIAVHVAGWVTPHALSNGLPVSAILLGVIASLTRLGTGRWPIQVGSPGDPIGTRLADDPPIDIAVVVLLVVVGSIGLVVNAAGFRGAFGAIVPFLGIGLFGLLGYALETSPRAARSITTAISGLPIMLATGGAVVDRGIVPVDSVYGELGSLITLTIIFLIGLPAFYLAHLRRPDRSAGE